VLPAPRVLLLLSRPPQAWPAWQHLAAQLLSQTTLTASQQAAAAS
jgi:hypothetical protein